VLALTSYSLEHVTRMGALLMPRLMVEAADDPELFAVMREVLVDPRRDVFRTILERAIERGELRADVNLDDVTDLLIGPMIYEVLITGADLAAVAKVPERIFDLALEGLRPASPARARRPPAA
jgi:hypothetical protein